METKQIILRYFKFVFAFTIAMVFILEMGDWLTRNIGITTANICLSIPIILFIYYRNWFRKKLLPAKTQDDFYSIFFIFFTLSLCAGYIIVPQLGWILELNNPIIGRIFMGVAAIYAVFIIYRLNKKKP